MSTTQRQLTIKTGAAKRLFKEHTLYRSEVAVQEAKINEQLTKHTEDDWEVKNARRLLDETHRMIVDSKERLAKAAEELQNLVTAAAQDPELSASEELAKAKEVLEQVSA